MAIVLKRETHYEKLKIERERKYQKLKYEKEQKMESIKNEIKVLNKSNYLKVFLFSLFWSILLFMFFPFPFLFAWLYKMGTITGDKEKELEELKNRKIKNSYWLEKEKMFSKGEEGENKVSEIIEKNSSDEFLLMNDIVINTGGWSTQIDHLLISNKGIYCIETKNWNGTFYEGDEGWAKEELDGFEYGHPQNQSINHADKLRCLLERNYLSMLPIYPVVVLTNNDCKWKGGPLDFSCPVYEIYSFLNEININNEIITNINFEDIQDITNFLLDEDKKHNQNFYSKFYL